MKHMKVLTRSSTRDGPCAAKVKALDFITKLVLATNAYK